MKATQSNHKRSLKDAQGIWKDHSSLTIDIKMGKTVPVMGTSCASQPLEETQMRTLGLKRMVLRFQDAGWTGETSSGFIPHSTRRAVRRPCYQFQCGMTERPSHSNLAWKSTTPFVLVANMLLGMRGERLVRVQQGQSGFPCDESKARRIMLHGVRSTCPLKRGKWPAIGLE